MFDVGRICLKIAGRDANKFCVIVEKIDDHFVLVDGQTRRKKVNIKHLEPTRNTINIKEKADHGIIVEEFSKLGMSLPLKKSKKATERPKKSKIVKEKKEKKPKKEKKLEKSETKTKSEDKKIEKVVKDEKSETKTKSEDKKVDTKKSE